MSADLAQRWSPVASSAATMPWATASGMVIRPMDRHDVSAVMGINQLATGQVERFDRGFFESLLACSPDSCLVVADDTLCPPGGRGLVVGYLVGLTSCGASSDKALSLAHRLGWDVSEDTTRLFLWQLAVSPSHRRRGVASLMLDAATDLTGAGLVSASIPVGRPGVTRLMESFALRHDADHASEDFLMSEHQSQGRYVVRCDEQWHSWRMPA